VTAGRRAVLFDIGGPIDTEVTAEALIDGAIRAACVEQGISVDATRYGAATRRAVESFASDCYEAICWDLAEQDTVRAARLWQMARGRLPQARPFEPRAGIVELLVRLHARGVLLGVVANQPASVVARLAGLGIDRLFSHVGLSGVVGLRKPDPRLFLAACDALGVAPADCVMVGDRIDNDIAPAKALGMRAVRLRAGRHAGQRPRSWREVPDEEVNDVPGLAAALGRLIGP
jgi:HAD superfamily hydrolase (TIGR01549 family)